METLAPCKKLVRVEVDANAVDKAFDDMTNEYQRAVTMPGFRAGKAPRHMVLQRHSADIEQEVKRRLIPDSYKKAVEEQKLRVLGYPDIEEIQFGRGQPLQFAATVETAPEFELPGYKGLTVKREAKQVTDEDVERAVGVLREQRVTYTDVQRPVCEGDFVVVNYTGSSEGKPISEIVPTARGLTEQKNFWIEIKPGSFLPGFTEQLIGRAAGDKQTVNVTFPKNFVAAPLSEKPGAYEVEVVQVKEKALPELNEEFAKSFGAESLAKLREGVRGDLENELKFSQDRDARNQVVSALLAGAQFDLPESVVQTETRNAVYDLVRENQQRGVSREAIEQQKDQIYSFAASSAKERVKALFVLNRIAEQEHLRVEQQELAQRVYYLAQANNTPIEKFAKQLDERGGYAQIQQELLTAKVLDFLLKEAKFEEVPAGTLNPAA
ncbi:MAG TPA: trigger factor [Verrucomicrobiae bacterium]